MQLQGILTPVDLHRPWFYVLDAHNTREDAIAILGRSDHVSFVDGLGDADYWSLEFPCGLKLLIEYMHGPPSEPSGIFADLPVPQHAKRHVPFKQSLVSLPEEEIERQRSYMIEKFADQYPMLKELDAFQVWRQGDDGNEMPVGHPTTERDAKCWIAELESHKHKQTYWYTRVKP